jgi:glutaredoxin
METVGTLYVKEGCVHCQKVLDAAKELELTFNLKDVADASVSEELVAAGGKKQEPYFIHTETGIGMYEAGLITAFLKEHYRKSEAVV